MKKLIALMMVLCMALSLVACGASNAPAEAPKAEAPKADAPAEAPAAEAPAKKGDFSANVNVARASDYAKTELQRPVTGIGRGVSTDVTTDGKYTIVVMTKNSTNPYMIGMWTGGELAAEALGIEVITTAPATDDSIEEQVSIMETYIDQGVDAFIIHPSDSNGIQPAVDMANAAGIPVVSIGTASNSGSFIRSGVDYYETGYETMKVLCEEAGGKGGVIILEGPAGAQNAEERKAGALDALAEFPEMTLLASQTASFKRAEAITVMENILQGEGIKENLTVVYGCNDEMALGAYQVLKASGISGVLIGGADGNKDAAAAIAAGDLFCTYNTDPCGSTFLAIVYLVQYLDEGIIPEEYFIPFPSSRDNPFITAGNVEQYTNELCWFK